MIAYSYKYDDMQLGFFDPATVTQRVLNAAKSKIEGVELEMNWATSLEGLTLTANLNYLDGTFDKFQGDCYTGQTITLGCNLEFNGANFLKQDSMASNFPLLPSGPAHSASTYETPVGEGWRAVFSGYATYQGKYETIINYLPGSQQKSYWLANASVSVFSAMTPGKCSSRATTSATSSGIWALSPTRSPETVSARRRRFLLMWAHQLAVDAVLRWAFPTTCDVRRAVG